MPQNIWYLVLLLLPVGLALIVPAARRWDRDAPSDN